MDLYRASRAFIFTLERLITRPLKKNMPVIPFPPRLILRPRADWLLPTLQGGFGTKKKSTVRQTNPHGGG
jgi:hypothetical protein